jgi:ankyrin repeat protein
VPELVACAARGKTEAVAGLLASGADPNTADEEGWTALHAAAVFDHLPVVRLLLEAGAAVDPRSADGFTPLLNGARASADVVDALLAAGADPNAHDERLGWRPLDRFADYGNVDGIRLVLAAGAEVDARDFAGATALMAAAENGEADCVALLLDHGADASIRTEDGSTAASLAARRGHHALAATISG